ncbi:MAG: FecCD family ABC transporter permease, partial [Candidatus Binatia bacterium]
MTAPRLTAARAAVVLGALGVVLAASLLAAASVGSVKVSLLSALDFSDPQNPDFVILFRTRLPRVLLGAAVGSGLAAAGAALQALLRNSLASPDVIGISGGASVGAVVAISAGAERLGVPAAAFLGSLGAMALIVRLSTVRGRLNPYSLLLVGVIVNTIAAALFLLLSSLVAPTETLGMLSWLSGSLSLRDYGCVAAISAVMVAGTLVLWSEARGLNLLSLGEEAATQLGLDVERLRVVTFLASAMLVGAAVSVSGIIGFVGLIVPHVLRLLFGSDHRLLVPASFLGGAIFLVWADALARVAIAPAEIP